MAARVTIRRWLQKRFRSDDYLLLVSSVCLIAATALAYQGAPLLFFGRELIYNPSIVLSSSLDQAKLLRRIVSISTLDWAYLTISWTTIYFVKFGFLSLFRHLVDRLPSIKRFWQITLVFTVLVFAFAVCSGPLACPKKGFDAGKEEVDSMIHYYCLTTFLI